MANYTPTPLGEIFLPSRAPVNCIMGPLGSGKTVLNIVKIAYHAQRSLKSTKDRMRKSRWTVVRNTSDQLRDTTIKSWLEWFPDGTLGTYKEYTRTYYIKIGDVYAEVLFRALDKEADARRVLSLDTTGAYLNEWREINKNLFFALRGRCGRYPPKEALSLTLMDINSMSFEQLQLRHNDEIDYLDELPEFKIPPYVNENNYTEHMNDDGELIYTNKTLANGADNPLYQQSVKISLHDWFGIMADTNPPAEDSYIYETFETMKGMLNKKKLFKSSDETGLSVEDHGEVIKVQWALDDTTADMIHSNVDPLPDATIDKLTTEVTMDAQRTSIDSDTGVPQLTDLQTIIAQQQPTPGIFQRKGAVPTPLGGPPMNRPPTSNQLTKDTNQGAQVRQMAGIDSVRAEIAALLQKVEDVKTETREAHGVSLGQPSVAITEKVVKWGKAQWLFIKQPSGLSPNAENKINLPSNYYGNLQQGSTELWINVHVKGKYGATIHGTPVYKDSFNWAFHCVPNLMHNPMIPIVIGMDFGRNPAAIIKQRQPDGRVLTLREFVTMDDNRMGLELFIQTVLRPGLVLHYPGMPVVVAGDPAGAYKQQGPETTLIDTLESAGFQVVIPNSNKIADRLQAVEYWLKLSYRGQALYQIDSVNCPVLCKGFQEKYIYRKKRTGQENDVPDKNEYSHPHDANQYGDMIIHDDHSGGTNYLEKLLPKPPAGKNVMEGWT